MVGIEPDPAEAARLRAAGPYSAVHAVAVGRATEARTLYVTRQPGFASLLPPAAGAADAYTCRDFFTVQGTTPVDTTTLDRLFAGSDMFDLVKLDVQGLEYDER